MDKNKLIRKIREKMKDIKKNNKDFDDKKAAIVFIAHMSIEKAMVEKTKDAKKEALMLTVGLLVILFDQELKINLDDKEIGAIAAVIKAEAKHRDLKDMELEFPTREEILKDRAITHYKDALASILYNFDQVQDKDAQIRLAKATLSVVENILFNEFSDRAIIDDFLEEMPEFISDNLSTNIPDSFYTSIRDSIKFTVFVNDTGNSLTVKEVLNISKREHKRAYETISKLELNPNDNFGDAMKTVKEKLTESAPPKRKKRKISLSAYA